MLVDKSRQVSKISLRVSCSQMLVSLLSNCLSGRIPVRLYVWSVSEVFDDLEDAPIMDSWDKISFINRPVEIHIEEGKPCIYSI